MSLLSYTLCRHDKGINLSLYIICIVKNYECNLNSISFQNKISLDFTLVLSIGSNYVIGASVRLEFCLLTDKQTDRQTDRQTHTHRDKLQLKKKKTHTHTNSGFCNSGAVFTRPYMGRVSVSVCVCMRVCMCVCFQFFFICPMIDLHC